MQIYIVIWWGSHLVCASYFWHDVLGSTDREPGALGISGQGPM